jgi:hypothetical protein
LSLRLLPLPRPMLSCFSYPSVCQVQLPWPAPAAPW